jgi:hypothetical protein
MSKTKDVNDALREVSEAAERRRKMLEAATKHANLSGGVQKLAASDVAIRRVMESTRALEMNSSVRAAMEAMQSFRLDPAMQQIMEATREHQNMMRAALGPLDDFRRMAEQVAAQFRLPEMSESTRLARQIALDMKVRFEPIGLHAAEIQRAMESMRTPWLDIENTLQSARGFAALQGIGAELARLPAFDDTLTVALREQLGDWRESIAWRADIFEDIGARSAFYAERGLDPSLTDFPAPAFDEAVTIAGLDETGAAVIEIADYEIPAEDAAEEPGYERTNAAHDRLFRFEVHMRRFIDRAMTQAYGDSWIKQRVHGDVRKEWVRRRDEEAAKGKQPGRLIDYADFTDYEPIMLRTDHWEAVFKPVFGRSESLRESLQRLYPIRLCTMHARLITQDDQLLLYVEVKRILKAIGVLKN